MIGNARKACRYFGVSRSSFYRWRAAYEKYGKAGLKNTGSSPVPDRKTLLMAGNGTSP
ncbi:helix-turn-helix domain-containing protein [Neptunicoccus cionae]|uniref:helix-turn-helix domain-containing protein n=1 Tax=Neptunicoccus cionae TaxID=2035344 RepID=UPI0025712667|nr:helix-turn-helix domain-containing protein [Amylibacter cionae]